MILPNNWQPRWYQLPLWEYLEQGGLRASAVWHRRGGKDDMGLHWAAVSAQRRVGNYWHMLPEAAQARKAIWSAVNPHTGIKRVDEAFPKPLRRATRDQEMSVEFKNGATWQVVGSDNYDSLVGAPPVGLVFSEWALANPAAWAHLRPILLENNGWALFIGTPRGHNHAKRTSDLAQKDPAWFGQILTAEQTDVFTADQLRMEKAELIAQYGEDIGTAIFEQEYMSSFNAAIIGAFFTKEMRELRLKGRVNDEVEHIPGLPVHTMWDLGISDPTAITFVQFDGPYWNVINFFQSSGAFMADYVNVLENMRKEHGYVYGAHIGPHDLEKREFAGQTVRALAASLGLEFEVSPKMSKVDSIHQVRKVLPRCRFHATRCEALVSALEQHRCEYNDKTQTFNLNPVHDWTSHPVDSFKYGAQAPSYSFSRTWEDDGVQSAEWGSRRADYDAELDRVSI